MGHVKVLPTLHVSKTGSPSSGPIRDWPLDIEIMPGVMFAPVNGNESHAEIVHDGKVVARLRTSTRWRLVPIE